MAYGVIVQEKVAAMNIDAYQRPCVSATAVENGFIFNLLTKDTTSGSEVWTATNPVTGSLTNLWMAYEPELVVTTSGDSKYRGIDPDPRNFQVAIGDLFTAFKLSLGDLIMFSPEGLSGSKSTGDYAVAANSDWQFAWSAAPAADAMCLKYHYTGYISIADGSIGSQRIVGYKFEVTKME